MPFSSDFSPRVSVVMPVFRQAQFMARALESLRAQTLSEWELIVVADGPCDEVFAVTEGFQARFPDDARWRAPLLGPDRGVGAALNRGLDAARAPIVAYLPADDALAPSHLADLLQVLENEEVALAFAGARHHGTQQSNGPIEGYGLQLVQVAHRWNARRAAPRWSERDEITTDDWGMMLWDKLRPLGRFQGTGRVSCEWFDHPQQRHKVVREDMDTGADPYLTSGLNAYRARYGAREPLRYRSSVGNAVDEVALYEEFRARPATPRAPDSLKILMVGELAFNPERVLALEECGHQLFGLWMPNPGSFNTVGPLPFGHVTEVPRLDWPARVREIAPDVIYGLLNWRAVPFAHQVMSNCQVPFVWHLKEGPFHCRDNGTWRQLAELHTRTQGQVYSSPELREWFGHELPATRDGLSLVIDGDLPKRERLAGTRAPLLSAQDGAIHTVLAGRPMGLHPEIVEELAGGGVHLHVYGEMKGSWADWLEQCQRVAPQHLHQHAAVAQDRWVSEFSRYDAAWLHLFPSHNGGHWSQAGWDDLNYPARLATYMVAGLPLIQFDNEGAIFATDALARQHEVGVFFRTIPQLIERLRDQERMQTLRDNAWQKRHEFTFDHHADALLDFFRQVMRSGR